MMEAKELRIGNWIFLNSKNKPYQIMSGHDIEEIEDNEGEGLPIPLTEEMLIKIPKLKDFRYFLEKNANQIGGYGIFLKDHNLFIRCIYNVHTLQNFHHYFTNEEIEIKL